MLLRFHRRLVPSTALRFSLLRSFFTRGRTLFFPTPLFRDGFWQTRSERASLLSFFLCFLIVTQRNLVVIQRLRFVCLWNFSSYSSLNKLNGVHPTNDVYDINVRDRTTRYGFYKWDLFGGLFFVLFFFLSFFFFFARLLVFNGRNLPDVTEST